MHHHNNKDTTQHPLLSNGNQHWNIPTMTFLHSVYESTIAYFAEHEVYQVIVDHDFRQAAWWEWTTLAVLLYVASRWILGSSQQPSVWTRIVAWTAVALVSIYALPGLTALPYLSTVVKTRTAYPWMIVLPHCIVAHSTYRYNHCSTATPEQPPPDRLQALVLSFSLYGFGGSVLADLAMGLPVTALAHVRIVPSHVIAWLLVWYSPADVVYRTYHMDKKIMDEHDENNTPASSLPLRDVRQILRCFLLMAEAIDAVMTPLGRMARAARELHQHGLTPLVAGILAGSGGAAVRYMAGRGAWEAVEAAIYKALGYCLLFGATVLWPCAAGVFTNPDVHHCDAYIGSDLWRVTVFSLHVAWTLLVDAGVVTSHPFIWMGRQIGQRASVLAKTAGLGPVDLITVPTASHLKKD